MDDARKFIRYVMPGLAAMLQLLIAFGIVWPTETFNLVAHRNDSIALLIGGVLASGGLGYLLSIVYYWLTWEGHDWRILQWLRAVLRRHPLVRWLAVDMAIDHRVAFQSLDPNEDLQLFRPGPGQGEKWKAGQVAGSLKDSWAVATLMWFGKGLMRTLDSELRRRVAVLTDAANGHGTTLVGSVLAAGVFSVFLAAPSPYLPTPSPGMGTAVMACWIAFLVIQAWNFVNLKKQCETLIAAAILTDIRTPPKVKNALAGSAGVEEKDPWEG